MNDFWLSITLTKSLTCCRKMLSSGYDCGSRVAWKIGMKIFSSIFPKWGTKFLALKMSLDEETTESVKMYMDIYRCYLFYCVQHYQNILDSGYLNHPLKVRGKHPVLVEPAGEFYPLIGIATIDGQTRLGILVPSILEVAGYFLCNKDPSWLVDQTLNQLMWLDCMKVFLFVFSKPNF